MGDCRIQIAIDRSLFGGTTAVIVKSGKNAVHLQEVESSLFAADTTIADCFQSIQLSDKDKDTSAHSVHTAATTVWSILDRVSVWDCTSFPTKNITQVCKAKSGRTLFSAGWFPSGTLQLLRPDATHSVAASAASYQDMQYNVAEAASLSASSSSAGGRRRVDVKGVRADAVPSQVIHSVVDRHAGMEVPVVEQEKARQLRLENKLKQRVKERERGTRLDQRIQELHAKARSSSTSAQVRNMLIKKRATGRSTLHQDDRIYFHCVWDEDGAETVPGELYRFFSLQETVGRALDHLRSSSSSSTANNNSFSLEMLVHCNSAGEYRRLPTTLVFQDAVREGYLTGQVDTIVLRYCTTEDGATTDITEDLLSDGRIQEADDASAGKEIALAQQPIASNQRGPSELDASTEEILSCLQRIKFKATSPAVQKVRQMKMKNKAKGDAKRVGDISKRFFVELIVVDEATTKSVATPDGYFFVAHHDPVDRFLRDSSKLSMGASWSLFSYDGGRVNKLASSNDETMISWEDAQKAKLVQSFDQVVLKMCCT